MAPGSARDGGEEPELTVGELAAAAGMTVRNVRAYAARGLLPPPRLVGRTGMYGPHHVARLALVREMLQEGYTLAAIERSLEHAPASGGPTALALHRALMAPWRPEEPEEMDLATLGAKSGVPSDPADLGRLAALGVLEPAGPDLGLRPRPDPARGRPAGGPARRRAAGAHRRPAAGGRAGRGGRAGLRRDVPQHGLEATSSTAAPAADWPRLRAVVEQVQPVAAQALLASFRSAMATAVATELEEVVALVSPDLEGAGPVGGAGGEGR